MLMKEITKVYGAAINVSADECARESQANPAQSAGAWQALAERCPRLRRFGVCIDDILARKNVKTSKLLVRPLERSGAHPRQCFLPSGVPRRSSG